MNKIAQIIAISLFFFYSCQENKLPKPIVQSDDLQVFFEADNKKMLQSTAEDLEFWQKKFQKDKGQYAYLLKIAETYSKLFEISGNDKYLLEEGTILDQVHNDYGIKEASLYRALAQNAMNQHAFHKAIAYAQQAKGLKEKEHITDLLLNDLYGEIGQTTTALQILSSYKRKNSFAYLIRKSKALDGEGNLNGAIEYMDQAAKIAKENKDNTNLTWTFNMLGDYHGHAGKFQRAYQYFLKALQINPLDAFAAQKIISILIDVDQNYALAKQMLDHLKQIDQSPLLQITEATLAKAQGENDLHREILNQFVDQIDSSPVKEMYRSYLFYVLNDELDKPGKALPLALEEINMRPTPESYDLQMWALFNQGKIEEANQIAKSQVIGKSEEPIVLYHLYELYQVLGNTQKATDIKSMLTQANLELGHEVMNTLFGTT